MGWRAQVPGGKWGDGTSYVVGVDCGGGRAGAIGRAHCGDCKKAGMQSASIDLIATFATTDKHSRALLVAPASFSGSALGAISLTSFSACERSR